MMKMHLSIILLFFSASLFGQESDLSSTLFSYRLSAHQAFVLVHSEEIRPFKDAYPIGLQADFSWQKRNKSSWDKCHCFPNIGASVQFWDFDNADLGYGINTYFFVEPEFGSDRFFSFSFRGGYGASILTNPYHEIENPSNQSYSTHLAFSLILSLKAAFRISPYSRLDISPYYNHISNGGVKDPNKGINYPSISVGYTHYLDALEYNDYKKSEWTRADGKERIDISPFISWKQMANDVHVFSPGIEIKYSNQISSLSALTTGLEYLEDNFQKYRFETSDSTGEWKKLGAALGHEFLLGKLIFSQQLGYYLYNPDWEGDILYQRWGLVYYFADYLAFGINLKAHRNVADFVDFRISVSL